MLSIALPHRILLAVRDASLRFAVRQGLRRGALLLAFLVPMTAAHAAGAIEVTAVKVSARELVGAFEFDGVIEPVKQSTVAAQANGRVARLAVKAGDAVRAGQLLATIDDSETRTALQRSHAQAAQADAVFRNAQAQYERTRELQLQGFISMAALDTAKAAFQAAQAGRDEAAAGQRQSAIAQGFTQVTAPYDGWVLETLLQSGDLAVPGKPLLTLYAPLPLRAVVQVPASRAAAARSAAQVEVRVEDAGGALWIAPVARAMLPAADPVAQTLEWRLELPAGPSRSLAPGQQVRVRFSGGVQRRVLVPAAAVLRRGELTAVYVVAPDGAGFVLKAVRLGTDRGADGLEVLAGLNASDAVAIDAVKASLAGARPALAP
jgi:RND family efflux transporter MFP subunit